MNLDQSTYTVLALTGTILPLTEYEYRLHRIDLSCGSKGCDATIYDGDRKLLQTHASDEVNAVKKAKHWIDEQDETSSKYDLH